MASLKYGWKAGHPPSGVKLPRRGPPLFNALTSTAHSLQELMASGKLKSIDLVEEYILRIEEHNPYLHAISDYAPDVMSRAQEMDAKRAAGSILGPLHGIPVLLKNTIATHPSLGMETTSGAVALLGSEPAENALVVDQLLAGGAVILGKTSVSELSFFKGDGLFCGWSALDGQGQSPYVRGGLDATDSIGGHSVPGGSSSGLAIAISAGLAPLGVGADTDGSILAPSVRTALYSLRPTLGLMSTKGFIKTTHTYDTPGVMAKDVQDLADITTVLTDHNATTVPSGGYSSVLKGRWKEIRIGTLDPLLWKYPEGLVKPVEGVAEELAADTAKTYARLKALAGVYHENVELRSPDDFMKDGVHSVFAIHNAEFEGSIDEYLSGLTKSNVRSLKELSEWNIEHAQDALPADYPSQQRLLDVLENPSDPAKVKELREYSLEVASSFDTALEKYGIDIIIGPGDSFLPLYASVKGYPACTLPMSYSAFNGRPFGIFAVAADHKEALLFEFMNLYEAAFPPRQPPAGFD